MDNYTRVKKAITFSGPDRIPLWAPEDPESAEIDSIFAGMMPLTGTTGGSEVKSKTGEKLRLIGVDGIAVTDEVAVRGIKDEWGSVWKDFKGTAGIVIDYPLSDWKKIKDYKFPDPYKENRFDDAVKKVETIKGKYYILAVQWSILLERMCWLMGHTNVFELMLSDHSLFNELAEGVVEYGIGIIKRFADIGADGFLISDDWGIQSGTWIRPKTFDEFFKPFYVKIIDTAHEKGLDFWWHSCGNFFDLIPNFIDCGADVINTWQPRIMGIERLGEFYGGKICFNTSADIQVTLPSASEQEVRGETKLIIEKLGLYDGGLIGVTYGPPIGDAENVRVMIETFREFKY